MTTPLIASDSNPCQSTVDLTFKPVCSNLLLHTYQGKTQIPQIWFTSCSLVNGSTGFVRSVPAEGKEIILAMNGQKEPLCPCFFVPINSFLSIFLVHTFKAAAAAAAAVMQWRGNRTLYLHHIDYEAKSLFAKKKEFLASKKYPAKNCPVGARKP